MGFARNAVITSNLSGSLIRQPCNRCGMCLYGCARASIYNSKYELASLLKFDNFNYLEEVSVKKIISSNRNGVSIMFSDGRAMNFSKVLLGAGTINSTFLVLDYLGLYKKEIRLLNNPVNAMAFVVPELLGSNPEENSFALGQLGYKLGLSDGDYATGLLYGAETLPLKSFAQHMPFSSGYAFKLASFLQPSMILATSYLPGKYSDNSLSLDDSADGKVLRIVGSSNLESKAHFSKIKKSLTRNFIKMGALYIPGSSKISVPGSDAHLAGTLPMGAKDDLGCSNYCELNSIPNVYIVDGSSMSSLPPKHLTFTLMANARRVASHIVSIFK